MKFPRYCIQARRRNEGCESRMMSRIMVLDVATAVLTLAAVDMKYYPK
jgi:hypothetical protein